MVTDELNEPDDFPCRPKLVTVPAKLEKREKAREAKAEVAAKLDRVRHSASPSLILF